MAASGRGSGATAAAGERPWSRADRLALAVLVVAAAASLPFLSHAWYDATNDGSMYLSSARSLLAGEGYSFLGEPFTIRPPGMAVLLAPLLAWFGQDFRVLNLAVGASGVLAVALFFVLLRSRLGWRFALLGALLLWTNTGLRRSSTQLMSDVPGLAALLLVLVAERGCRRRPGLGRELWLGLLVAAASYLRTINVLLVPAIALARLLERARRPDGLSWRRTFLARVVPFAGVALACLLPWSVRNALVAPPPPADQTFLHSYGTGMWHEDPGDPSSRRLGPGEVLARIPTRAAQVVEVLGSRQSVTIPSRYRFLALGAPLAEERREDLATRACGVLFLLAAAACLYRRRAPEDLFTWLTLGVLSVYFGFDDRLCLPVFVLALGALLELAVGGARGLRGTSFGRLGPMALGLFLGAWIALDFHAREGWERTRAQHEAFARIAAEAAPLLHQGDRVGSAVGWHYGVYLERPVFGFHWAMKRVEDDFEEVERVIDRRRVNVVLLSPLVPADQRLIGYFARRYPGRVERTDSAFVVRVRG